MARQPDIQYINAYVSGNIAYQMDVQPARKKRVRLPKPKAKKQMVLHVDPVAVGGILVAAVMLVLLVVGFVRLQDARAEAAVLESYVQDLQAENQQLAQSYKEGYDLEEIRQIALAMGMIPASEAQTIAIPVSVPQEIPEPTAWENFCAFLTGLFA